MPRFRKKPVEIEAVQWDGHYGALPTWVMGASFVFDGELMIQTPNGKVWCRLGDWIIRGGPATADVCKSDVFEATYTPWEEPMPIPETIRSLIVASGRVALGQYLERDVEAQARIEAWLATAQDVVNDEQVDGSVKELVRGQIVEGEAGASVAVARCSRAWSSGA